MCVYFWVWGSSYFFSWGLYLFFSLVMLLFDVSCPKDSKVPLSEFTSTKLRSFILIFGLHSKRFRVFFLWSNLICKKFTS